MICACGHAKVHHFGWHFDGHTWRWLSDQRCWAWVAGQPDPHRGGYPCKCKGWMES
jgi:hypothetical protein